MVKDFGKKWKDVKQLESLVFLVKIEISEKKT